MFAVARRLFLPKGIVKITQDPTEQIPIRGWAGLALQKNPLFVSCQHRMLSEMRVSPKRSY